MQSWDFNAPYIPTAKAGGFTALFGNNIDMKFPVIFDIWNLTDCYHHTPLYAILRNNLDATWLNTSLANLEAQCEEFEVNSNLKFCIQETAKRIIDSSATDLASQTEFTKLVNFYGDCLNKRILLTDLVINNFGYRDDKTLVLRDLGGAYLCSQR